VIASQLLLIRRVLHQSGDVVLLDDVEVDLARLFCRPFFVVLDAWGTKATSVGRTAFYPYTRMKGEYPVTELTWVRRPQTT
jgi:hypothetical protein